MSTLPEQLSAARKAQLESQMDFFQNFAGKSIEGMQKMLALNLSVSRASMEKSSAAVAQLLTVKDPRDLFALTNTSQDSLKTMLAYSREMFAIAIATGTGTGAAVADAAVKAAPEIGRALAPVQEAAQKAAQAVVEQAAQAVVEQAAQAVVEQAVQEVQEWTEPEPVFAEFVAPVADPEPAPQESMSATPAAPPEAEVTQIAKAVGKVASKPVAAKPAAAPVPAAKKATVVTGIKPVDASPPPASAKVTATQQPPQPQQQLDLPAAKSKKRK